jgi:TolA-binding protein
LNFRKLLAQIDLSKTAASSGKDAPGAKSSGGNTATSYELLFKPEQIKLQQTARVAQLEQRLHSLETAVGDIPNKLVSTQTACIEWI